MDISSRIIAELGIYCVYPPPYHPLSPPLHPTLMFNPSQPKWISRHIYAICPNGRHLIVDVSHGADPPQYIYIYIPVMSSRIGRSVVYRRGIVCRIYSSHRGYDLNKWPFELKAGAFIHRIYRIGKLPKNYH